MAARTIQELLKTDAEGVLSILPHALHAGAPKGPQQVLAVANPEVVIDQTRLPLKVDVLVTPKKAQHHVAVLRELVFGQVVGGIPPDSNDPGQLGIGPDQCGHFGQCRRGQVVGLRACRLGSRLDLQREIHHAQRDEDRSEYAGNRRDSTPVHKQTPCAGNV
jgi:hypothetical protein